VKPVVFSDLDGTLLHPATYSFREALEALGLLKEHAIPLVLSSSKTRAEIEYYREMLSNTDPFVSENGGGIFIPEGYFPFPIEGARSGPYRVITLGRPYGEVRKALAEIRSDLKVDIRGFGDMTVEEVAGLTGLNLDEARRSLERDYDEPFVFNGEGVKLERVLDEIKRRGFNWTRGRFLHILGSHDKGRAVRILKGMYARHYGAITTVGLGDSLNDLPLLKEVDVPVLVAKRDGSYEPLDLPGLVRAEGVGPKGWNRAVVEIVGGFIDRGEP